MFSGAFRKSFQSAFITPEAAVATFTPTQLTGLKLWYAPRTLGLTDGTAISTNTDRSGNGWDATATTTARPTFKTNIVNGLAIARYDGSANGMGVAAGALGITNNVASCTMVSIFSTTSIAAVVQAIFTVSIGGGGTVARTSQNINRSAGKAELRGKRTDAEGSTSVTGSASLSTSTFYIFVGQVSWTTNVIKGYLNGGTADISGAWLSSGNTAATDSTNIKLGVSNTGAASFFSGDLGDQLMYVPALSLSDLNLLGAYLGTTYGLTWTTAV